MRLRAHRPLIREFLPDVSLINYITKYEIKCNHSLRIMRHLFKYVGLTTWVGPTTRPIPTTGPIPQMGRKSDVIPQIGRFF